MQTRIKLPPGYRKQVFLAFHSRDLLAVSEQIDGDELRKGILWNGVPACLTVRFSHGYVDAARFVDTTVAEPENFAETVLRMLGLTQPVAEFEHGHLSHMLIGPMIAEQSGLRVPLCTTPFEALTWAITGQQISLSAAVSLRRRMIQAVGVRHSSGLLCYPTAAELSLMEPQQLKVAGFSQTKASTLIDISKRIVNGQLPLDSWLGAEPPADVIREHLLAIKGIGPWTVNYALLRGHGWLDGSLHGDAAVRRGIKNLLKAEMPVTKIQAMQWLMQFSPWRALVAAHIWASQATVIQQ